MNVKQLSRVEIKDEDRGEIEAVFSTFDVIDHDGDVTLKGAFTDGAPVAISAYGHRSWSGELPVGKGVIRELSNEAVMVGRFFMDTQKGLDTFRTVKAMSEGDSLQEWSYSLDNIKARRDTFEGKQVRIIEAVDVTEVSPVLKGAGINTRTLATKGRFKQPNSELHRLLRDAARERWGAEDSWVYVDDYDLDEGWVIVSVGADDEAERLLRVSFTRDDDTVDLASDEAEVARTVSYAPKSGARFSEHAKSVLTDVDGLITRASEVMALRAHKGKSLGGESADLLEALSSDLDRLKELIEAAGGEPPTHSDDAEALAQEYLRFVASSQGAMQ